jgi:hypothetical protein
LTAIRRRSSSPASLGELLNLADVGESAFASKKHPGP